LGGQSLTEAPSFPYRGRESRLRWSSRRRRKSPHPNACRRQANRGGDRCGRAPLIQRLNAERPLLAGIAGL
jgi:hypothetical protein